MKSISLFLALASIHAFADTTYVNFVRQNQQGTGVIWDMPVAPTGTAPSALSIDNGGSLFQLWTVEQSGSAKEYLLDQKLVGAYLPKADIKITTLDPYAPYPRTRVDQPFTVQVNVAGLLTGTGLPDASTKVLLEQHIQSYPAGQNSLVPTAVQSNTPLTTGFLTANGPTVLKFPASSLKAGDPTKATGEEHFVVHALSDGTITQTQIASAYVQILPVASGAILGIKPGEELRYQIPTVQLNLNDLYPRSDTYLILYEGTGANGSPGTVAASFPMDRDRTDSQVVMVPDLATKFKKDGTYTLALMSSTVYGTELLCDTVTFSVKRSISVNAMQVNYSDGTN